MPLAARIACWAGPDGARCKVEEMTCLSPETVDDKRTGSSCAKAGVASSACVAIQALMEAA
eukprot:8382771-Heterocapsa_arctica.AAC.1